MSCTINYEFDHCSSRDCGHTCVTCYHYKKEEIVLSKLISNYKSLLNLKNPDHRGNLKFVESYVSRIKKSNNWLTDAVWFVCEAIDLHKKTLCSNK